MRLRPYILVFSLFVMSVFLITPVHAAPPNTTITASPPATTNQTSATFSFTSNISDAVFGCNRDNTFYFSCTSPYTFSSLAVGSHTVQIRATSTGGSTDATPATYTWVIDTTPPDTTITSSPASNTTSTSASFSFTSNEGGVSFGCNRDNTFYFSCTSPYTFSGLAVGSHTVQIRATDSAGNIDATPASYTWVIDTTAPTTPTGLTHTTPSTDTTPTFTWTASTDNVGVTNYQVQIQNSMEANVISATDLGNVLTYTVPDGSALSAGTYTFYINAHDAAGNSSSPFTTLSFTISTPPANMPPAAPTGLGQFKLDGVTAIPVGGSTSETGMVLKATVSDPEGQAVGFWIEIQPVGTAFTNNPALATASTVPSGTVASYTYTPMTPGSYHWQIRAFDSMEAVSSLVSFGGNAESAADVVNTSDGTPPTGTIVINNGAASTSNRSVTLNLTCSDNVGCTGMHFSNDISVPNPWSAGSGGVARLTDGSFIIAAPPPAVPWATYSTTASWTLSAGDGTKTVYIQFRDAVGNVSSTMSDTIVLNSMADTTPPAAPGSLTRTTPDTDTTPTFTWTAATDASGISFYDINIDGAGWRSIDLVTSWTSVAEEDALALGSHTFQVRAADNSPNRNIGPAASLTFTITGPDTSSPLTPTGLTRTTADTNNSPTFTWNATTDNVAVTSYEYQLDGGAFQNAGTALSVDLSTAAIGSHTFGLRARDAAGNISSTTALSFTISAPVVAADTTAPTSPTGLTRTTTDTNLTPAFSWSASTDAIGVTGYDVQIDAGTFISAGTALTYTSLNALAVGTHTFGVRARDEAGNLSGVSALSFTVSVPPATSSNAGTASGSTSGGTSAGGTTPGSTSTTGTGNTTGTSAASGSSAATSTNSRPPFGLDQMLVDAQTIVRGDIAALLPTLGLSNAMTCQMDPIAAALKVEKVFPAVTDATIHAALNHFTSCGTVTTLHLGAGERLGVVNSYKSAFGRVPSTAAHWFDVIKLGNGRFPGEASATAQTDARARFSTIYKRAPNTSQPNDSAAVTIMAYGLRPLPRNVGSEAAAINIYKKIFGATPLTAPQWDALRAIAYSGAVR